MKTMTDISRHGARRFGDRTAVIFADAAQTYEGLEAAANRVAHRLSAMGIGRGSLVAYLSENTIDYPAIVFGAMKTGATLVPMNFRYGAVEAAFVLTDCAAALLIHSEAEAPVAAQALSQIDTPPPTALAADLTAGDDVPETVDLARPEDMAMVMYTSGTTGFPKGVLFSHRSYLSVMENVIIGGDLRPDDVMLLGMPMFHNGGLNAMLLPMLALGGLTVIQSKGFNPDVVLAAVERHRVTVTMWVPTMLSMLVNSGRLDAYDTSSLGKIWYGSSPIMPTVLEQVRAAFSVGLYQFYGMTETGMTSVLRPADHDTHAHCTGRELFNSELRIVDAEGRDVPVGGVGELLSRQEPTGMSAYLNRPEETARTAVDGWIHTGDMARREENGLFAIVDRRKDMLISGAENIYPSEIEQCISRHPAVLEVAVFGIPDDVYGESVCAVVVRRPGSELDEMAVIAWCQARIASYKKPKLVMFVDEMPKNATGKITKHSLRDPFWEGRARKV